MGRLEAKAEMNADRWGLGRRGSEVLLGFSLPVAAAGPGCVTAPAISPPSVRAHPRGLPIPSTTVMPSCRHLTSAYIRISTYKMSSL